MLESIRKIKCGFSIYGLILFLIIMCPNFVWFFYPAPNDVLSSESITVTADMAASVCQVLLAAFLILFINTGAAKFNIKSKWMLCSMAAILFYYIGWVLYYCGVTNAFVILVLCIAPCLSFLFYEVDRKNWIAMIPTVLFTILHLYYGVVNFVV